MSVNVPRAGQKRLVEIDDGCPSPKRMRLDDVSEDHLSAWGQLASSPQELSMLDVTTPSPSLSPTVSSNTSTPRECYYDGDNLVVFDGSKPSYPSPNNLMPETGQRDNSDDSSVGQVDMEVESQSNMSSELSPSSSERWINCPGSVEAQRGYPDEDSDEAKDGTTAHRLAAICLKKRSDPYQYLGRKIYDREVTEDMCFCVKEYIEYVTSFTDITTNRSRLDTKRRY